MGNVRLVANILAPLVTLLMTCTDVTALVSKDSFYNLGEVAATWDGTDANRTNAATTDYDYTYGDESSVTYTLPWPFNFYGVQYRKITIDTNGNIWFDPGVTGASPLLQGSVHSFDLASTGRGPVIAAWNEDLSSYFYGGTFVQHKTNPERVVIEWQTETYTEEGYSRLSDFEVVLFQAGKVGIDYKSFDTASVNDFGSGVSKGDGTAVSPISNFGNVFSLAGRSFLLTDIPTGSVVINGGNPFSNSAATVLTLAGHDADGISEMQFGGDNVAWSVPEPFSSTKNWTVTDGDGTKTVYAKFKDTTGNWSAAVNASFLLDTVTPTTTASPGPGVYDTVQTVVLTCDDGSGSGCDKIFYTTDGTTPTTRSLVYNSPVVIPATKRLRWFAVDKARNVETVKTGEYTIVDTTPAGVPIITNFSVPTVSPSLTVTGIVISATVEKGVAGYLLTENSAVPSPGSSGWSANPPASYTFASEGAKTLYAWAMGTTGLVSASSSASVTIAVPDTSRPTVDAFTLPTSTLTATVPINSFLASDNVAVTGYLVTESATSPLPSAVGWSSTAPSSYKLTGLNQGVASTRTLYAFARDAAGNVSAGRSASVTVTVTGPTLAFSAATLADGTATKNPALDLSGNVSGNGSAVQSLTLAQNDAAPNPVPFDINGRFSTATVLANGPNTLTTVATDMADNSSTDTRTITLDPNLSDLVITAPANGSFLKDRLVTVTGRVGAPQSTSVTVVVNGAAPEALSLSGQDFTTTINLDSGINIIVVTATDSSKSAPSSHTATLSITSDVTAPTLKVTAPASAFATAHDQVTLSGSVTDAVTTPSVGVTVNGVQLSGQPALAADGSFAATIPLPVVGAYAIAVTAIDQAGNHSTVQRNVIRTYPSGNVSDGVSAPTIVDALKVLQFAVGLAIPSADEQVNVDVAPLRDGKPAPNGVVDTGDALVVLEKVVGTVAW